MCCTCKRPLPAKDFYANPTTADGLHSQCKACQDDRIAIWRERNKERWRESDPKQARGNKKCSACGMTLERTAFCINRSMKDGLMYRCKECEKNNVRKGEGIR